MTWSQVGAGPVCGFETGGDNGALDPAALPDPLALPVVVPDPRHATAATATTTAIERTPNTRSRSPRGDDPHRRLHLHAVRGDVTREHVADRVRDRVGQLGIRT